MTQESSAKGIISGSRRTAILVIHGVGQQKPYETLDNFTRNLIKAIQSYDLSFKPAITHNRISWGPAECAQSYFTIQFGPEQAVDVYEFYWAHLMTDQCSYNDIMAWMRATSRGARELYSRNAALLERLSSSAAIKRGPGDWDSVFDENHLFRESGLLKAVGVLPVLAGYTLDAIRSLPFAPLVLEEVEKRLTPIVMSTLGDVVVYTSADDKAQRRPVRGEIIRQCGSRIADIMTPDTNTPDYDSVILAGHSLGSVILIDALNWINNNPALNPNLPASGVARRDIKAECLKAIVTFGSPLDKVHFYFRDTSPPEQTLRAEVLDVLYGFGLKALPGSKNGHQITNGFRPILTKPNWLNFYGARDIISGHLDFYDVDVNHHIAFSESKWVAHTAYWNNLEMYQTTIGHLY